MPKIYAERPETVVMYKPHSHRHNPKRKRPLLPVETPERPVQPPVSVPFQWEEVPGKPKQCYSEDVAPPRLLDPPPRLWDCSRSMFSNTPSPNTVLDGPYVGSEAGTKSVRAFSFRKMLFFNGGGSFRSSRGPSTPEKQEEQQKQGESKRWGILHERGDGDCEGDVENEFSSSFRREFAAETTKKLWETLYESFKQVVPWRRND
ncbi:hypothetical protein MLD38_031799 [Melastoma candidum]|uniref:Uncharacterized protein n=1 Tax=Melastoma candidum TaxID=119954 RepID=A0ACB9MQT1_9MYRT|nr:hypothetical protein MLD38_031799 [Melastoma candidum]